jgi:hypothetical protein
VKHVTQRRNKLCGQINSVLCFFSNCDAFIKVKLLISYCYSIYGSVLWDLGNPSVEFICRTWRKGLRRALGLPIDASSKLLPGLSGTLPIMDELYKRSLTFIQRCLTSDCTIVSSIAKMAVFSLRMTSPLGRNAFLCCKNLGKSVEAIHNISPTIIFKYVATRTDPFVNTLVDIMHELLCIRDRQLWFSSVDFDVCDADDFINCIARSLYL